MMQVQPPKELREFVEKQMLSFECAAHGMDHVMRVCHLARTIGEDEGANIKVVYIAALCHDVLDSKLLSKEDAGGAEAALVDALGSAMEGENKFLSKSEIDSIIFIVKNIGYRKLLDKEWDVSKQSIELRCVQDADLLDAIGGVGIARCFAFGGKRNRRLFELSPSIIGNIEMTQEAYAKSTGSGLEHFFEKLLRIPCMMSTSKGAEIAKQRKLAMVSWIESIREELNESTDNDEHATIITQNLEPFLSTPKLGSSCCSQSPLTTKKYMI